MPSSPVTCSASRIAVALASLVLLVAGAAHSDTPGLGIVGRVFVSEDGSASATFDGTHVRVEVRGPRSSKRKRSWIAHPKITVAEGQAPKRRELEDMLLVGNGDRFVLCGPTSASAWDPARVVLSFHSRTTDLAIPMGKVITQPELLATTSGFQWGACLGRGDQPGTYVIETAACRRFVFNTADGSVSRSDPVITTTPRASGCGVKGPR